MDNGFVQVGIRPVSLPVEEKRRKEGKRPIVSVIVLGGIILGCVCCGLFTKGDPGRMDLYQAGQAPDIRHWFGTDTMGRDLFTMIWYGGRISLFIGVCATVVSTLIAVFYATAGALGPKWADALLTRFMEIFLCVPGLLLVVLVQALLGKANVLSLSFVIGITGWTGIARVVRTQVSQIRSCEYVIASRCMGAGFFRILRRHLAPNFASSILFMVIMNIRGAILYESTLSFMGLGLPLDVISWGSMLSLAGNNLIYGSWWTVLIPGAFLVATLLCITNIGSYLQKNGDPRQRNL